MTNIVELKTICNSLRLLYVEDDADLHFSVLKYLKKLFKDVDGAYNGEEGLHMYQSHAYDIVLTDIKMPKLDGLKMTEAIKKINPNQDIVILSAHTEQSYFLSAIHLGVSDYIIKPIDYEQMNAVLYKVTNKIKIFKEYLKYHEDLEKLVVEKTKLLADNYEHTLIAMVEMIEQRDSYTGGHSERVAGYSKAIAQEMGLPEDECELIYRAGMLHDIGKVTTPDTILLKPGKLSEREYVLIKEHVGASYELLSKIPMYSTIADVVLSHHEKYDGSGYPNGLKGDEIPLLSKIMIIADSFDAMTTNRIYKARKSIKDAVKEINDFSGIQFDPAIVPYASKALSRVTLQDTSQLPKNIMEEERFSYFYRDGLTDTYNYEYLEIFLQNLMDKSKYQSAVYYLKNFSQYNSRYGWNQGNDLLKQFAKYLRKKYPDAVIFRIYGDDFTLITEKQIVDSIEECSQPPFLSDTKVSLSCNIFSIDEISIEMGFEPEITLKSKFSKTHNS